MSKWLWLQTIAALVKVFRIFLFEKLDLVVLIIWWLLALALTLIMYWLDYRVAIGVLIVAFAGFPYARSVIRRLKPLLIRSGDLIEYAQPSDTLDNPFKTGIVVSAIPKEEVLKRRLFDVSMIEDYARFYLVMEQQKSKAIPYEWIVTIEVQELPIVTP